MLCPGCKKVRFVSVVLLLASSNYLFADNGISLSLQEAETLAIERDAKLSEIRLNSESLQERAVAEGTLPDPKLKVGLANFPTDTFDREQEPMT